MTAHVAPQVALSVPPADEVKTTTCYMCACRCGIKVHLKDGPVRYIEGNSDAPGQQGRAVRQGLSRHHEALLAGQAYRSRCCAWASEARASSRKSSWEEALNDCHAKWLGDAQQ